MLNGADFKKANLVGAVLTNATVGHTNFVEANLCGADMRCIGLETAKWGNTKYNSETIWLDSFEPQTSGLIKQD